MAVQAVALSGDMVTRSQPRVTDQRSEPRRSDLVDRAALSWRGQDYLVPVVNISSRGTMIESELTPRLGESVVIRFDGCSPVYAFVRWIREGRIGLNFGCELTIG